MARRTNRQEYTLSREKKEKISQNREKSKGLRQGASRSRLPGTFLAAEASGQNFTPLFDIFYPVGYIFSV